MKAFVMALVLVLSLAGCDTAGGAGSSPERPIYYQCSHP